MVSLSGAGTLELAKPRSREAVRAELVQVASAAPSVLGSHWPCLACMAASVHRIEGHALNRKQEMAWLVLQGNRLN